MSAKKIPFLNWQKMVSAIRKTRLNRISKLIRLFSHFSLGFVYLASSKPTKCRKLSLFDTCSEKLDFAAFTLVL